MRRTPIIVWIIGLFTLMVIGSLIYMIQQATSGGGGNTATGGGTTLFWVLLPVAGIVLVIGTRDHWKADNSKIAMLVVSIFAGFAIIYVLASLIFGHDATERARSDMRDIGNNFANRVDTPANQSGSARELPCGEDQILQLQVGSATVPTRFTLRLNCRVSWVRPVGTGYLIRYNGLGEYELWDKPRGSIFPKVLIPQYAEVLQMEEGPATTLAVIFAKRK